MSFQTVLTNHTPFAAEAFVLPTPAGQEALLLVVAATFEDGDQSGLRPPLEPPAVRVEDVYEGEPGASTLLFEGELALSKAAVDVVVVGTAYAPGGRHAERVAVEVSAGDVYKALWITGPRRWEYGVAGPPEPFVAMPIRYERAFGGVSPQTGRPYMRNPIGVGFDGATSAGPERWALPMVEYAAGAPGAGGRAAGLTPIGRAWQPRASYAGTYDSAWLAERWPLLPTDFDPRHNQCAPEDQQSSALRGGERVRLLNLTPDGIWDFRLPRLHVPVHLLFDAGAEDRAPTLDTVVLEPDARRVRLTARLAVETRRGGNRLREVVVGHKSAAWWRAHTRRKRFIDRGLTGGADRSAPTYS